VNRWLKSLIDRMMLFVTAFGLEVLVNNSESWVKLPIGLVLAVIVLLVCLYASTTLAARAGFSLLGRVHALKNNLVNFTRGWRGAASGSRSDAGDAGDGDGQGGGGTLSRSGTFMKALNRLKGLRPLGIPTRPASANQTEESRRCPQDATAAETGDANSGVLSGAV